MMAHTQLRFLLVCVCILLQSQTKGVSGQCSTPPINVAGYEGTLNTVLPCNSPTKVSYTVKPTSDELTNYKLTNYNDVVPTTYTNLYDVNSTGLIVKKYQTSPVTPPISTSGLYVVYINGSTTKYGAKVLVVRLGPNCTCNTDNTTTVQLNCSITYADSAYHPVDAVMTWTSNGNFYTNDTPTRTRPNKREFISSSVIQVNGSDLAFYQCNVAFAEPRDPQFVYVATNAPEFSASCDVPCLGKAPTTSPPKPTTTTTPETTTTPTTTTPEPTTTTPEPTTPEPTTTTPTTTTPEPTTTTPTTTTPEPTTPEPTTPEPTTPEPTTTTPTSTTPEPITTAPTTTEPFTTTLPSTPCHCSQPTACPTPGQNCVRSNECQSDGTNTTDVYNECVVKAELYARCDNCCTEDLICGVVVTLRNDSRWLIYDPQCDDNKCEMVVVSASCMSTDWKPLSERKITRSGVGDYVQTGYSVQSDVNVTDCSGSCKRMMNLP